MYVGENGDGKGVHAGKKGACCNEIEFYEDHPTKLDAWVSVISKAASRIEANNTSTESK
jgi:hypothetical protein